MDLNNYFGQLNTSTSDSSEESDSADCNTPPLLTQSDDGTSSQDVIGLKRSSSFVDKDLNFMVQEII